MEEYGITGLIGLPFSSIPKMQTPSPCILLKSVIIISFFIDALSQRNPNVPSGIPPIIFCGNDPLMPHYKGNMIFY